MDRRATVILNKIPRAVPVIGFVLGLALGRALNLPIPSLVGLSVLSALAGAATEAAATYITGYTCGKLNFLLLLAAAVTGTAVIVFFPYIGTNRAFLLFLSELFLAGLFIPIIKNVNMPINKLSVLLIMTGCMLACAYVSNHFGCFSEDSFSYFEISKSFCEDFGKVNTIRQYVIKTDYNISFPYFYPLCIFIADIFSGLGIYSGAAVNIPAMALTSLVFLYVSREFSGNYLGGAAASLMMFTNGDYLEEVCAGRAIPLALLLNAVILIPAVILLKKEQHAYLPLIIGAAAGAAAVTRFDEMTVVPAAAVFLLVAVKGRAKIKALVFFSAGVAVPAVPWVIYSLHHFGALWITDNSGTMFLVKADVPNRVYIPGSEPPTLFNAPAEYLNSLADKMCDALGDIWIQLKPAYYIVLIIIVLVLLKARSNPEILKSDVKRFFGEHLFVLCFAISYFLIKCMMYAFVGYGVSRYYAAPSILLSLVLFSVIGRDYKFSRADACVLTGFAALGIAGYCFSVCSLPISEVIRHGEMPEWVAEADRQLSQHIDPQEDSVLMLNRNGFFYGGWTGNKVFVSPSSSTLSEESVNYVLKMYADADFIACLKDGADEEIISSLSVQYAHIDTGSYLLFDTKQILTNYS